MQKDSCKEDGRVKPGQDEGEEWLAPAMFQGEVA
jgi:hypothetical protein